MQKNLFTCFQDKACWGSIHCSGNCPRLQNTYAPSGRWLRDRLRLENGKQFADKAVLLPYWVDIILEITCSELHWIQNSHEQPAFIMQLSLCCTLSIMLRSVSYANWMCLERCPCAFRISPLTTRRDITILGIIHRAAIGEDPRQLKESFQTDMRPPGRCTRHRHSRHVFDHFAECSCPDYLLRSAFGAVDIYNSLPQLVVNSHSVQTFQRRWQQRFKYVATTGYDERCSCLNCGALQKTVLPRMTGETVVNHSELLLITRISISWDVQTLSSASSSWVIVPLVVVIQKNYWCCSTTKPNTVWEKKRERRTDQMISTDKDESQTNGMNNGKDLEDKTLYTSVVR